MFVLNSARRFKTNEAPPCVTSRNLEPKTPFATYSNVEEWNVCWVKDIDTTVLFSYTWSTVPRNVYLRKPQQVITPRQRQLIAFEVMQQIHLSKFLYPFQLHRSCECHCHLRRYHHLCCCCIRDVLHPIRRWWMAVRLDYAVGVSLIPLENT